LMTCCGYGGPPYNYDITRSCQSPNATVCTDGSKFVSWDGVHLTEAANAVAAAAILSSAYSIPKLKFDQFCKVWLFIFHTMLYSSKLFFCGKSEIY
jgi:hypothetical protein